ncbi:WhiB family transcriptional regulator [Streptomyces sp. NPDC059524]|uniref:WhiB family transcriptional regulator n=1 Tax=Streptomyces sp. NPDC059524 TaxID=3346856 RepID=UPI003680BF36
MTRHTTNGTRRPITLAARTSDWPTSAACRDMDDEPFFSDKTGTLNRLRQTACADCPVLVACLRSARTIEGDRADIWGLRGGLTADQRRALRAELLLGGRLDLDAAVQLLSWQWQNVLWPLRVRGDGPQEIANEVTRWGMPVSAATVRVALWWLGARAHRLPRRGAGDRRLDWQLVRDERRDVVEQLRELGAPAGDIAAYLGLSRTALERAAKAWSRSSREAAQAQEVGLAA